MSLGERGAETDIINPSVMLRKGTRKRRASINLQDFLEIYYCISKPESEGDGEEGKEKKFREKSGKSPN